jgi:hypothetical protein
LYNGQVVWVTAGTGAGQFRVIDDYVGSTRVASISPNWVTTPDNTSVYVLAGAPASTASPPAVNVTQIAGTTQTANDVGADVDTILGRVIGTIAAGTHTAQTGDTFARLGAPAGASISADIAVVDANVDAVLVDTGTTLPATLTTIDNEIAVIDGIVDSILEDTGTTIPAAIGALNDLSAAEVNAEVVDALATDTYAEPGQGAPAATESIATKIGNIHKAWRNKTETDGSTHKIYADNGTTVDHQATVGYAGETFTRGEMGTGA